nr:hypothetical protein [Tanacetum cinerariifolium]
MVAYLSKSDASKGFNQIINFLNESSIKYALMVNPNIYVSCIKQFWTTVAVKQVNDVTRLQVLVDRKKVVVTEATIREALRLDDVEGVDCLPNEEIFTELARMGYEKPSTKLTFYKAFFSSQVETSDDTMMDDESNQGMMIAKIDQDDAVVLEDDKEEDKDAADAVKDVKKAKVDESAQVQGRQADSQVEIYKIDMDHANKVLSMKEDKTEPAEVQEMVDVVTTAKLITEVVIAASETVTAASAIITAVEAQVPAATLTVAPAKVVAALSRRRKGMVIRDPEEESTTSTIIPAKTKSKDKGKGILVEEPKPLKKKQQIKQDEQYARELHAELNKDIDWDEAIDHVKRKAKEDPAIKRYQVLKRKPQNEAQPRKNMMSKEQMDEEDSIALKRLNETTTKKAAKRRKLDEEEEDLKRHLQIVPNKDDDVYTKATPLARKVPVVDYEIIEMNNKPYYKIIRDDGTHQLYISFLTLLRNFDREDLKALWSLVKERFFTAKPTNFFDDFLLTTLGAMFEMPDAHAQIWKNQRSVHGQAKVKSWKLLESCGHNFYNHTANFVSGKEVPTLKIYSRPNVECCKTSSRRGK